MPDLIAQGPERRHRWRRRLADHQAPIVLGRDCGPWSVTWDQCISRTHARLTWIPPNLLIERLPSAGNPIFVQGHAVDAFPLKVGEHFVIGETRFTLAHHDVQVSLEQQQPADERTFSGEYLRRIQFRHAHRQIQALSRLPEIVASAQTEGELYPRVIHLLLTGILTATAAAWVDCPLDASGSMHVLHWDRLDQNDGVFQPSGRLIRRAIATGENVVHMWRPITPPGAAADTQITSANDAPASSATPVPTELADFDWAFCIPIPGVDCHGQVLYVAGCEATSMSEEALQDMLKFVELVATTVGNICDVRRLQRRTAALDQFFSPPVRLAVEVGDPEVVLAPCETEVAVLFCDLRGFSRRSEEAAGDLFELLRRVSEALGIATHEILETGGVIGDFHGDAAMGFWGWPIAHQDRVQRACCAALEIQRAFQQAASSGRSALSDFQVGMGLATGPAVAGKIGTADQVKVTAFGPVVNLAARLEGMTRLFGLPILIDQVTATQIATRPSIDSVDAQSNLFAVLPLPPVRPYGLTTVHRLYWLSTAENGPTAHAESVYRSALSDFEAGRWPEAQHRLQPISHVATAQFLLSWIQRHGPEPPNTWNGTIHLERKS